MSKVNAAFRAERCALVHRLEFCSKQKLENKSLYLITEHGSDQTCINHTRQHVGMLVFISLSLFRPFTCSVPWPSSVMTTLSPPWRSCVRYECWVLQVLNRKKKQQIFKKFLLSFRYYSNTRKLPHETTIQTAYQT